MFCQLQVHAAGIVFETWGQLLDVVVEMVEIPP